MIGVAMRNEKRAADSRSSPANSPAEIEIPDRLIPGTRASAWATPIANALRERQVDREQPARTLRSASHRMRAADDEHQSHEPDLPEPLLDDVVEQEADDQRRDRRDGDRATPAGGPESPSNERSRIVARPGRDRAAASRPGSRRAARPASRCGASR